MTEITSRLSTALAERYRIERRLGEGGMATVYLAEDVKHDRKVALKVLRPELAAVLGADRFLQEIKTTANLQHPHILPLFDSGTADGFLYYVMPFIDGDTLRDKLNRETQFGIEEAVQITRDVADALDYAHRQGVIHRDIKPENILLHDGRPMVADFGIALAVSAAAGGRMTETGLSLGTPHYMSPEQATAEKDLTNRADIYSLGCVLYEMLTGSPPHVGSSAQQIIMKIVTDDARPVTELRKSVPPSVAAATAKALEKLPADRFHSAAEFADALVKPGLVQLPSTTVTAVASGGGRRDLGWRHLAVAGALAIVTAVAAWGWLRPTRSTLQVARFDIAVSGSPALRTGANGRTLAIAPDGSRIVYVGIDQRLYVRDLNQLDSRQLPGSADHTPFFSPDGEWVGFSGQGSVKKVALAGGPPLTITEANQLRGATWGEDGTIAFAPSTTSGILRVAAGGGALDTLTHLDRERGETSHRFPEYLPGDHGLLFQVCRGGAEACEIAVLDLRANSVRYLLAGLDPHYVAPGYLVYAATTGALLAVPFDVDRMEVTGSPVSLAEGILIKGSWNGDFAISRTGSLIYVTGQSARVGLSLVDTVGTVQPLLDELPDGYAPRFSPDAGHIAVRASQEGDNEIWTYDVRQGTLSRLTFEGGADYPAWAPGGDTIYYSAVNGGADRDLWRRAADGSGAPERVLERPGEQYEIAFAPGGEFGLMRETASETGLDLLVLPLRPPVEPRPWVVTSFSERSATLAPDGHWAAYVSNESGQDEVYVRAFPEAVGRWQVSTGGGQEPLWSRDGNTIYYRRADSLFAVGVRTRPTFAVGQHRLVLTGAFQNNTNHTNYDRDAHTGRFVMLRQTQPGSTALVVVLNWFEELRTRMGKGR